MVETSVRLLRVLSLLQSRPDWRGPELAERLGVTTRTVRNDVERLRVLGYQISSTPGTAGGYRLGAGAALPPLMLDDDEAVAVVVSLQSAAGGTVTGIAETSLRALTKVEQMMPSRLRRRVDALRAATLSLSGPVPTVDPGSLTVISAAIRDRERIRFDYVDHGGNGTARTAEPSHLVHTGRRWFLLAWDVDRDDWRSFRVDRMTLRTPNRGRFARRGMTDEEATAFVLRGAGSAAWPFQVRVVLHAPVLAMAERLTPAAGLLEAVDDSTCVLVTGGGTLRELTGFLLSLEVDFTVLEPPELREYLGRVADRLLSASSRST